MTNYEGLSRVELVARLQAADTNMMLLTGEIARLRRDAEHDVGVLADEVLRLTDQLSNADSIIEALVS